MKKGPLSSMLLRNRDMISWRRDGGKDIYILKVGQAGFGCVECDVQYTATHLHA